jgi:hypothetical protein
VQNEKPRNLAAKTRAQARPTQTGTSAILHTTYGDIHIRLYPDAAPKAVENFVTHARNGYYNNTIFHRVIRKFMIQVRSSSSPFFLGEVCPLGVEVDLFSREREILSTSPTALVLTPFVCVPGVRLRIGWRSAR